MPYSVLRVPSSSAVAAPDIGAPPAATTAVPPARVTGDWAPKSARATLRDGAIVVEADGKAPFLTATNLKLQGPLAPDVLREVAPAAVDLDRFGCVTTETAGVATVVSRTGWSRGVGFELYPLDAACAPAVWDALAQCEASGNWAANTGNGYYGGLQFNKQTWDAYGGTEYAAYPHQATREQQIDIAERVRDSRGGYGAWPHCSSQLGLPK